MQNSKFNYLLIERFAELEKLCNGIYNTKHGVTSYIEHMEKLGLISAQYKKLKDVRHKRNKLSHGEVPFDMDWATEEDIAFVIDFKKAIENQIDPISTYIRQEKQRKAYRRNTLAEIQRSESRNLDYLSKQRKSNAYATYFGCFIWMLVAIFAFAFILRFAH